MNRKKTNQGGFMQRRDALKFLATGALASTAAPDLFGFFQEAHPATGYALRTLNPHQNATVVLMSEIIIPETDTPGAKGARVNEFIDVILTDWAIEEDRNNFLAGLLPLSNLPSCGLWTKPSACSPAGPLVTATPSPIGTRN
jgi:hypothetical protein